MPPEIAPAIVDPDDVNSSNSGSRSASGSGLRNGAPSESGQNGDALASEFDRVPRRVGKYEVLAQLGRGGMANVFLAVAKGVGGVNKLVVLKALLPEMVSDPEALSMFLDEARLAAQLNHANVVQTYEVGTEGNRHVIVMEYLEGQSFWNVLKRAAITDRKMSLAMQLRVVSSTLEGLHYAHELRSYDGTPLELVHRDVSPQNVFLTYDGQVKVLDFGIAKATCSSTQTATGVLKGKIAYMAPEQITGETVDRRADVFSVGCILWGVAAGKKLWHGMPDVQLMRHLMEGDIPSPKTVNPSCDDDLERIVMKALECEREDRYATALDLQADVDEYCKRLGAPITSKQLGAYVAQLFADRRAEIRAIVERQLTALTQQGSEVAGDLPSIPDDHEPSRSASNPRSAALEPSPPRKRWWVWGAAAAALLASSGYAALIALRATPPATAPAAPVVAAPSAEALPIPEAPTAYVTIQFSAVPLQASLYLDDEPLPSNPTSKVLPADDRIRHLRAEAEGYETVVVEFTAAQGDSIELKLPKVALPEPEPPTRRVVRPAPRPRAKQPAPAPTPKPDCAAPFIIDAKGIKRFRPECL